MYKCPKCGNTEENNLIADEKDLKRLSCPNCKTIWRIQYNNVSTFNNAFKDDNEIISQPLGSYIKCQMCGGLQFAYTEETKRRVSIFLKCINFILILFTIFCVYQGIFVESFALVIALGLAVFLGVINSIYFYRFGETSRTKCICKSCHHWWFI